MVERRTRTNLAGQMVDGFEVPIEESTERWSEFKLEDGTILRVKLNVISAIRVEGQYDQQGNPMYTLNMAPVVGIVESPERLRRRVQ